VTSDDRRLGNRGIAAVLEATCVLAVAVIVATAPWLMALAAAFGQRAGDRLQLVVGDLTISAVLLSGCLQLVIAAAALTLLPAAVGLSLVVERHRFIRLLRDAPRERLWLRRALSLAEGLEALPASLPPD
jgi:hypothetical protein